MNVIDVQHSDLKRSKEAEVAYRKATAADPKYAYAWTLLGNLLGRDLRRPTEAEVVYRKATEVEPKYAYAWYCLGNLLGGVLKRPKEAEAAMLNAKALYWDEVRRKPKVLASRFALAELLTRSPETMDEARSQVARAIELDPHDPVGQQFFVALCGQYVETLRSVLPTLAKWCAAHPKDAQTFQFTVGGFIRLSQLTKPGEVLALLDALPDATPFEILRDAFRAHGEPDYLHRLAPERRSVAIELLRQISSPSLKMAGSKPKKTKHLRTRRT